MSAFSFLKGRLKHMEDEVWRSRPDQEEDAQICPNCGYTYIVVGTGEPVKKYGFGYIQCLSCNMFIIAVADGAKREKS